MASFSFGAGNARKLAAIPLYAIGRLITLVVPRSRDEWVFGCGAGIGDGALALWDVVSAEGHPARWLVGSAREQADAEAHGIPIVPKRSLRGLWRTARARVVVVTHGFGDVNRYTVSGALVVQLWHGIPLKRIGLDSPETLRLPGALESGRMPGAAVARRLLAFMYRGAARRIRVLPAASHLVRGRLESAFALADGSVPVTGEPRVDVLSQGTPESRRSDAMTRIERAIGPVSGARLVLYAPTWRDGSRDPAIPTSDDWGLILDLLERHDAVLVVRSHPLGAGDYEPDRPTRRVRRLGSDLAADVTPLLPGFDALITDYSSLAFDAALVPLPMVFLAPDLDEYAERRGFYGSYPDVAGDGWATDWSSAVRQLDGVLGDEAERIDRIEQSRARSARVHAFRDGGSTRRVYRAILAKLAEEARPVGGDR